MYFNLEGKIDVAQMLAYVGGIDAKKFCEQIIENGIKITDFITCAEMKKWKEYYIKMHPTQILNEEIIHKDVSNDEIKAEFNKFFMPLAADSCRLTIIDPYLFASGTDVELLVSILSDNVNSKKVRVIANLLKADTSIKTQIESRLTALDFEVDVKDSSGIHDRWWYTRKSGFYVGTSFNGIGRKMITMNLLKDSDVTNIVNVYGV